MTTSYRPLDNFDELAYRAAKVPRNMEVSPKDVEELAAILTSKAAEETPATAFENGVYISTAGSQAFQRNPSHGRWYRKWIFRHPQQALVIWRAMVFVEMIHHAMKKSFDQPARRFRISRRSRH